MALKIKIHARFGRALSSLNSILKATPRTSVLVFMRVFVVQCFLAVPSFCRADDEPTGTLSVTAPFTQTAEEKERVSAVIDRWLAFRKTCSTFATEVTLSQYDDFGRREKNDPTTVEKGECLFVRNRFSAIRKDTGYERTATGTMHLDASASASSIGWLKSRSVVFDDSRARCFLATQETFFGERCFKTPDSPLNLIFPPAEDNLYASYWFRQLVPNEKGRVLIEAWPKIKPKYFTIKYALVLLDENTMQTKAIRYVSDFNSSTYAFNDWKINEHVGHEEDLVRKFVPAGGDATELVNAFLAEKESADGKELPH